MKKVFFILAFMLMGTFVFANENVNSNLEKFENLTMVVNMQAVDINYYNLNELFFEDYTMTIKNNKTIEELKKMDGLIKKPIIINEVFSCKIYYAVYRSDGSLMGSFTVSAPDNHPDCGGFVGIKIK